MKGAKGFLRAAAFQRRLFPSGGFNYRYEIKALHVHKYTFQSKLSCTENNDKNTNFSVYLCQITDIYVERSSRSNIHLFFKKT